MKTNCPNCGAPFDETKTKCQYCGTTYVDLSCIDFFERKPIFLRMRVPRGNKSAIVVQRVIPMIADYEIRNPMAHCYGYADEHFLTVTHSEVNINVEFRTIPMGDGSMSKMYVED